MSSLFVNKSLFLFFRQNCEGRNDQTELVGGGGGTDDLMVKQLRHNIEQLAG